MSPVAERSWVSTKALSAHLGRDKSPREHWETWVQGNQNSILAHLDGEGLAWVQSRWREGGGSVPDHLNLDGKWHNDRTGKQGYKGHTYINAKGVPTLSLIYKDFKHGGHSERFDQGPVMRNLWEAHKANRKLATRAYEPRTITVQSEAEIQAEEKRLAKAKAKSVARDLVRWENYRTTGSSAYLNRKGLPHSEGVRYGEDQYGSFIALLIVGFDGVPRGLQRIYDEPVSKRKYNEETDTWHLGEPRDKWFTWGLNKKGGFIVIGQLDRKHPPAAVAEGFATGLTYYLATGKTVLCALDAGNLEPTLVALKKVVSAVWRQEFTPPLIIADNDQWTESGNTGLIKAHKAALRYGCKVVAPDFASLDVSSKPTDFNDLHVLTGIESVREQLTNPVSADPMIAFSQTKSREVIYGLAQGHHKTVVNQRYLDVEIKPGLTFIKSPKGTGKTEVVKRLVERNSDKSILYLSHLRALSSGAATRLGIASYLDLGDSDIAGHNALALCINSLHKHASRDIGVPSILVIDEVEPLLERLTTDIPFKRQILDILQLYIRNAEDVVSMDADLSPASIELLLEMRGTGGQSHFIINEYRPEASPTMRIMPTAESVLHRAVTALEEGERVYFATDSKRGTRVAFQALSVTGRRGLLITGEDDEGHSPEVCAFFNDPNKTAMQYDFIVVSPAVSTGVDIKPGHFTQVFGSFTGRSITPQQALQALGRVREQKELFVYVGGGTAERPTDAADIAARWQETHAYDLQLMGVVQSDSGPRWGISDPLYERLRLEVTRQRNVAMNDWRMAFIQHAHLDGNQIVFETAGDHQTQQQAEELAETAVVQEDADYIEARLSAPRLTSEEANKRRARGVDTASPALDRYDIEQFFGLDNPDEATLRAVIENDRRGETRREIVRLELALMDHDTAKERNLVQYRGGPVLAADAKHRMVERELYRRTLAAAKVDLGTGEVQPYFKDDLAPFVTWANEHRRELAGLGIRVPEKELLIREPRRFVRIVLRRLGLKQKRVGKSAAGRYEVDAEHLGKRLEIIALRKSKTLDRKQCGLSRNIRARTVPSPLRPPHSLSPAAIQIIERHFAGELPPAVLRCLDELFSADPPDMFERLERAAAYLAGTS